MGLLKKYRHRTNPTACAIEFMKTVGADLHIRPNALCLYGQSILSISFTVTMIWWRVAIVVVQNGTLGRICKSAPTIFVNLRAQAVKFVR